MQWGRSVLQAGLRAEVSKRTDLQDSASATGSGDILLLATSVVFLLMEQAAQQAVADSLGPGETTVDAWIELKHLAPTPMGRQVQAEAHLVAVDGHRLVFEVTCKEGDRLIAQGRHGRWVVDRASFMARATAMPGQ
jgi:fluoroacetyl-CoA thioesterase